MNGSTINTQENLDHNSEIIQIKLERANALLDRAEYIIEHEEDTEKNKERSNKLVERAFQLVNEATELSTDPISSTICMISSMDKNIDDFLLRLKEQDSELLSRFLTSDIPVDEHIKDPMRAELCSLTVEILKMQVFKELCDRGFIDDERYAFYMDKILGGPVKIPGQMHEKKTGGFIDAIAGNTPGVYPDSRVEEFPECSLDIEDILPPEFDEEDLIFNCCVEMTPVDIYQKLKEKVYKQDEYCKKASMVIYNHTHGIRSVNVVNGPSGCGKTFLWETVKESIYPSVFFIDSKSITLNGFKGINLNEIMQTIPFDNGIVVFDEFDKLIAPTFDGKGANVSRNVQGDFLKVLDEGFAKRNQMGTFNMASTKNITFILCGSFYDKADEKAQKTVNRIGFLAKQDEERAYDKKVTLNDMIEFGMLKEIAGRVVDIMNVEPLSAEDYVAFLSGFENGGVKQIEKLYQKRISISDKAIHEIADEALHDSLGLRKAIGIIRRRVNEYIFENGADVEEISIM